MPKAFLHRVADYILENHEHNLSKILIVLPSQRAGLFLRRTLAEKIDRPTLGPQIMMVDQLASKISGLNKADSLTLQFELYNCYQEVFSADADPFDEFVRWSSRLLQDYNEIDRHLINAKDLFANLTDAKALERWGVEADTPEMIEQFLSFWRRLLPTYHKFKDALKSEGIAYQGLMFREAADRIQTATNWSEFLKEQNAEHVLFVGFNALNEAEIQIIRAALESNCGDILFDVDGLYLDDPEHEAGMFIRRYLQWPYFEKNPLSFKTDSLRAEKRDIYLIGVPRQIGMAKAAGERLQELKDWVDVEDVTDKMALVLADEGMLLPTLNSLPDSFEEVNVTMGLPIQDLTLASTVEAIFEAHERAIRLQVSENRSFQFYHKDIERIILQPFGRFLLGADGANKASALNAQIRKYNAPFLKPSKLEEWTEGSTRIHSLLTEMTPNAVLDKLAEVLAKYHDSSSISIEDKEASKLLYGVCRRLNELFAKYDRVSEMKTALHLFRQLQREEKLDFFGEPLRGLQVMGVLETRLLSFEGLVMTHLNEEQLPTGRSDNSFIPYDLKRGFGLPTHKEKDAIYAYHFYRLLQGTRHAYLLYNTEPKSIGSGEASRFIEQIRREFKHFDQTTIHEIIYSTTVQKDQLAQPFRLEKGHYLREAFERRATDGIAPSHLTTWVRDQSLFYKRYIIGMEEADEVEEVLGDRTMGLVVHDVLEDFYKPFVDSAPSVADFEQVLSEVPERVRSFYKARAKRKLDEKGRNALIAHAMMEMTSSFLKEEKKRAIEYQEAGLEWKIIGVESRLRHQIEVEGIDYPILIKGVADRIDKVGDTYVVIDYKTGMTKTTDVEVNELDRLATDESKGKGLQLFTYAWLLSKTHPEANAFKAGIFALRDNRAGLLTAAFKSKNHRRDDIYLDDIQTFESVLTSMLQSIFSEEGVIEAEPESIEES